MISPDELDEKEALIEFNRQRKKTYSQLMNETELLESVYSERAKQRMIKASHPKDNTIVGVATLPPQHTEISKDEKGKTRDIVADKVGMKGRTYTKAKTVWDSAKTGDTYARSLVDKLDKKEVTVNEAANRVKVFTEAPEPIKEKIIKNMLVV